MSSRRVLRGGSCNFDTRFLRSAAAAKIFRLVPEDRIRISGFRIVVVRRRKP